MSFLMSCGVCCMCLSVWAIIQLALMGVFYKMESVILIEDVCPHKGHYQGYDDFMEKTKNNYHTTAINCWICTGIYLVTFLISIQCIHKASKKASFAAKQLEDDEYVCAPKSVELPKKMLKHLDKSEKRSRSPSPQSFEIEGKNDYEKKSKGDLIARKEAKKQPRDI